MTKYIVKEESKTATETMAFDTYEEAKDYADQQINRISFSDSDRNIIVADVSESCLPDFYLAEREESKDDSPIDWAMCEDCGVSICEIYAHRKNSDDDRWLTKEDKAAGLQRIK